MPAALLDTDVFSYLCLARGHRRFGWRTAYESFLREVGIGTNFAISVISVGEILDGIEKGGISFQRLEILRVAFANGADHAIEKVGDSITAGRVRLAERFVDQVPPYSKWMERTYAYQAREVGIPWTLASHTRAMLGPCRSTEVS